MGASPTHKIKHFILNESNSMENVQFSTATNFFRFWLFRPQYLIRSVGKQLRDNKNTSNISTDIRSSSVATRTPGP